MDKIKSAKERLPKLGTLGFWVLVFAASRWLGLVSRGVSRDTAPVQVHATNHQNTFQILHVGENYSASMKSFNALGTEECATLSFVHQPFSTPFAE